MNDWNFVCWEGFTRKAIYEQRGLKGGSYRKGKGKVTIKMNEDQVSLIIFGVFLSFENSIHMQS